MKTASGLKSMFMWNVPQNLKTLADIPSKSVGDTTKRPDGQSDTIFLEIVICPVGREPVKFRAPEKL
jgi:hypothetical protein